MNSKTEGIKLLKSIRHIERMIEELQEEIYMTRCMLTSTTIKPKEVDVMTSKAQDPMGDKMAKILEYEESIENYQRELCDKKLMVIEILKQMEYEQQEMLTFRYLRGMTIEQVGEALGRMSYYHTWEVLHKAEERFCELFSARV